MSSKVCPLPPPTAADPGRPLKSRDVRFRVGKGSRAGVYRVGCYSKRRWRYAYGEIGKRLPM